MDRESWNTREEQSFPCSNVSRGELHVTLTDSSANGAAAYLNARKKDGIIKKGEKRARADRPTGRPAGLCRGQADGRDGGR